MLVRASRAAWKSSFMQPFLGSRTQLRNLSWSHSRFGRNHQAVLCMAANNSVNETPVQKLVALPRVSKDRVNIPAGTIKGCFDMLLGNPHKTELLADVPFLLARARGRGAELSSSTPFFFSRK